MRDNKGRFKKGCISYMKGKHHAEESILKNKLSHLGTKHTEEHKRKIGEGSKRTMLYRTNFIFSFTKYPELRFAINNGLSLCKSCHYRTHYKGGD